MVPPPKKPSVTWHRSSMDSVSQQKPSEGSNTARISKTSQNIRESLQSGELPELVKPMTGYKSRFEEETEAIVKIQVAINRSLSRKRSKLKERRAMI